MVDDGKEWPHLSLQEDGRECARFYYVGDVEPASADTCAKEGCHTEEPLWITQIPDLQTTTLCWGHAWAHVVENAPVGLPTVGQVYAAAYDMFTEGVAEATPIPLGRYAIRDIKGMAGRFSIAERGRGDIAAARVSEFSDTAQLGGYIAGGINNDPPLWERHADLPVDELLAGGDDEHDTSGWGVA